MRSRAGAGVSDSFYYRFHDLNLNGCSGVYNNSDFERLTTPAALREHGKVIRHSVGCVVCGTVRSLTFHSADWAGPSKNPQGRDYLCVRDHSR